MIPVESIAIELMPITICHTITNETTFPVRVLRGVPEDQRQLLPSFFSRVLHFVFYDIILIQLLTY
jgi:hypothetical protein